MTVVSPRTAVEAWLKPTVEEFLSSHGVEDGPRLAVERPARPEHGDAAVNLAMQLARPLRRNPLDIARELAAALPLGGPVASVEVAPPGFVNIRLNHGWLMGQLRGVVEAGADWGRVQLGPKRRVMVEFVSANPTGPLLFSHGRGAVVGDTIARILDFSGDEVVREFYINDAGRQVRLFGDSLLAARRGQPAPDDGYAGEYIQEVAAQIPDALLMGEPETVRSAVVDWGIERFLAEDRRDLEALGIRFDNWFSERALHGAWATETLDVIRKAGHLVEHDGATWLALPGDQEEVLYKSSGDATYFCGDLLYHRDKLVRRGFDLAIDVWGADHQNQVRRLKQAMPLIGAAEDRFEVVLVQMVHMRIGDEFVRISRRKGNLILLRDLVDEVGADAVRYHYLMRSSDSMMDFDLALARTQSNDNPVFYAQYAHARLCSIAAVAAEAGIAPDPAGVARLTAGGEVALAHELLELPEVVEMAAVALEPHHLPHYAQRLAEKVHSFYHAGNQDGSLRVVVPDRVLSGARLYLCEAARTTMSNILNLMGVSAPNRM
ncbi:MAG: arginine--tRNA ligase [Candidatus Dormibacteria bacterium]